MSNTSNIKIIDLSYLTICSAAGCSHIRAIGTKCLLHMKDHIQTTKNLEKYFPGVKAYRLILEEKVVAYGRAQKTAQL